MCERLKQSVLKTDVPERVPGVRIPLPPPVDFMAQNDLRYLDLILVVVENPDQSAGDLHPLYHR